MAARPQVAGEAPAVVDDAIVAFVDPGGVERRVPLAAAVEVAFEEAGARVPLLPGAAQLPRLVVVGHLRPARGV
jgi:hypothetical protein